MKLNFLLLYASASVLNFSLVHCAEMSVDDSSQDRGFWSDARDSIANLLGFSSPNNQLPIESSIDEVVTDTCSNCDIIICGNLIVTGTIVGQQCPPTPPLLSACPNLKIVHGTFTTPSHDQDPVITSCSGNCAQQCNWSVVRTGPPSSTSQFTVTFNPAFLTIPTVVATPAKAGGGGQVTVDTITTTSAIFDTNSSPDAVHFIAISCCG